MLLAGDIGRTKTEIGDFLARGCAPRAADTRQGAQRESFELTSDCEGVRQPGERANRPSLLRRGWASDRRPS